MKRYYCSSNVIVEDEFTPMREKVVTGRLFCRPTTRASLSTATFRPLLPQNATQGFSGSDDGGGDPVFARAREGRGAET